MSKKWYCKCYLIINRNNEQMLTVKVNLLFVFLVFIIKNLSHGNKATLKLTELTFLSSLWLVKKKLFSKTKSFKCKRVEQQLFLWRDSVVI